MNYFLLALTILFSAIASILTRIFSKDSNGVSVYTFNALGCVVWLFVLLPQLILAEDFLLSNSAVFYGILYGILLFLWLYSNCRAVEEGSYTLSRLISCPSFIIAALFGAIYCNEGINTNQIVGMVLICLSLLLCVNPKFSGEKITVKWFVYSFIYFLANGFIGVIYKLFGAVAGKGEYDAMLLTAALVAILLYTLFIAFETVKGKKTLIMPKGKTAWLTVLAGLFTCLFIKINIYLSNAMPSAVFFPVSNCAVIILSTLAGTLLFREKLSKIQVVGILIGLFSILITSISF